jgi:hypothetical protein
MAIFITTGLLYKIIYVQFTFILIQNHLHVASALFSIVPDFAIELTKKCRRLRWVIVLIYEIKQFTISFSPKSSLRRPVLF